MSHVMEVCAIHGTVVSQCRCFSKDKTTRHVPCPGTCVMPPPRLSRKDEARQIAELYADPYNFSTAGPEDFQRIADLLEES